MSNYSVPLLLFSVVLAVIDECNFNWVNASEWVNMHFGSDTCTQKIVEKIRSL